MVKNLNYFPWSFKGYIFTDLDYRIWICNNVQTAQLVDQTTDPGIVMPERYESSQKVVSFSRVVVTPVRHTHTRLQTCKPFRKRGAATTKDGFAPS